MSILMDAIIETVREEFQKKAPSWDITSLTEHHMNFLNQECNQSSEFDPSNKRKQMFDHLLDGKAHTLVATCSYGEVIAVLEDPLQAKHIPWELWGRMFRLYSEKNHPPFRVYLLANPHLRVFPPGKQPITPENINGGYTYPCRRETILIYRAEDATRVLLHEMMHSCCLDNHALGVDQVEAETEAWAELMYVALLSEGNTARFQDLLGRQSTWMVIQNEEVKKHMTKPNSHQFPWRYTIGKEEVWRRWGILSNTTNKTIKLKNSLRLTFPVDTVLKKRFHVKEDSTIL
jgi:hypothetical protein